jgi:hypothetical protein
LALQRLRLRTASRSSSLGSLRPGGVAGEGLAAYVRLARLRTPAGEQAACHLVPGTDSLLQDKM